MPEMLSVGELTFEVRRSSRRKTISIIVDRDGQLVIAAPQLCEPDRLHLAVQGKKQWIYTKLLDKETQIIQTPSLKEYVSGEGFFYLGKSYRLQIIEPDPKQARTHAFRFFRGQFWLRKDERFSGRQHFVSWYTSQCRLWIESRLPALAQRIGVNVLSVEIMDLGYRWGSCSTNSVNFHWRTILLPVHLIEYIMVHELAHSHEPNHNRQFWELVERVIPDWQKRKQWLAEHGAAFNI